MRTSSLGRLAALLLALLGLTVIADTGTDAAYVASTGNSGSTLSSIPDWKPPVVSRAALIKAEGGIPGYVRQGGSYTVVASVGDDPSSSPPAGVGTVTGDVSTITTGQTALALPATASTVGGLAYTHRSAAVTVPAGRAENTYTNSITASDLVTPPNTAAAYPFTAIVDNTAPTRTSALIANGGGVAGRSDSGDTITYLWSDVVDPESVLAGWSGTATQVTVLINNFAGTRGDTVYIRNAANTAQLPLGSIELKARDYVTADTTFGGPGNGTRSMMSWNATTGAITVTLGPADTPGTVNTAGTDTDTYEWVPQAVFDRAGNLSNITAYPEQGALDREF